MQSCKVLSHHECCENLFVEGIQAKLCIIWTMTPDRALVVTGFLFFSFRYFTLLLFILEAR